MSKRDEFEHQLAEVENKIIELEELRDDLYKRIDEETEKEANTNKTLTLQYDELHKLLCLLNTSVIDRDAVRNEEHVRNLIDFRHELSWNIAELFSYDLHEGDIDPKTYKYYEFSSKC